MKKNALLFLCTLLLSLMPYHVFAFEMMSSEEMKSVTAQAGISDASSLAADLVVDDSAASAPVSPQQNLADLTPMETLSSTPRVFARGAGISIMIDDVVLLITSMPDIIFLDNDGV